MTTIPTHKKQIVLKKAPVGHCVLELDKPDSTFELQEGLPLPAEIADDELLVKVLMLSNDPTQRSWISEELTDERFYAAPVKVGSAMRAMGLAKVLKKGANVTNAKVGDIIYSFVEWTDYVVIKSAQVFNPIADTSLPLHMYLDVLGSTGLTAYFSLKEIGQLKEGQSIVISAAGGATGSVAVQLAKHLFKASKIIALTGSPEKCEHVKQLGADVAINYKEADYLQQLKTVVGKDYVDVYFDLVGGETLDAMFSLVKNSGRIIACGAISGYNDPSKFVIKNYTKIITNRLIVQGFLVLDHRAKFPEAIKDIVGLLKQGLLKADASTVTVKDATTDFGKIPQYWGLLFSGEKVGKLITKVADADVAV